MRTICIASNSVSLLLSCWSKVWTWDLPCMSREYLQKDYGNGFEVRGSDGETQWTDLPFRRVPRPRPGHRKAVEASCHVPLCYWVQDYVFLLNLSKHGLKFIYTEVCMLLNLREYCCIWCMQIHCGEKTHVHVGVQLLEGKNQWPFCDRNLFKIKPTKQLL